MSESSDATTTQIDTAVLRTALEEVLSGYFGAPRAILELQRCPALYRSSFALEELDVKLDDGLTLHLLFKDVSLQGLSEASRLGKPTFLHDPLREIETYRRILVPHLPGAALCYGAVADAELGRYWLFLEKVQGVKLPDFGLETWKRVAQWLAAMHTRFARQPDLRELAAVSHLIRYDGDLYRLWPRRAKAFLRQMEPMVPTQALERFDRLAEGYDQVIEHLLALPVTLIHGELYGNNVLIQETADQLRVCPVDWEMTALGPGLLDLAALIAGEWTEEEKRAMALAYHDSLVPNNLVPNRGWAPDVEEFLFALDCCRLHIATQWLGWSEQWLSASDRRHHWLGEALLVGERVLRTA
jgi:thiamine kinase-like enzyme